MTEIKYIEGLYEFWDFLLEQFPNLLIDNCASGGRRIDIETCSRSVPLWRSDTGCCPASETWKSDVWNQNQTICLSQYLPFHSTSVWTSNTYDFRSAATMGIAADFDVFSPDFSFENAKASLAEFKQLQNYWKGSFYPLTPASLDEKHWAAFQFDIRDNDSGMSMFFRRRESPYSKAAFCLKGLIPENRYQLVLTDEDRNKEVRTVLGRELIAGYEVEIPYARNSLVIEYSSYV